MVDCNELGGGADAEKTTKGRAEIRSQYFYEGLGSDLFEPYKLEHQLQYGGKSTPLVRTKNKGTSPGRCVIALSRRGAIKLSYTQSPAAAADTLDLRLYV